MLSLLTITAAYSSGGVMDRMCDGVPCADQSCDAIGLCGPPPGNYCPKGMDKVRGPVRSSVYTCSPAASSRGIIA